MTADTITAGSITVSETLEAETSTQALTLYGVYFPEDLADAVAYMISDLIIDDPKEASKDAESIGVYSYSLNKNANLNNSTNFNSTSMSIINKYNMARIY